MTRCAQRVPASLHTFSILHLDPPLHGVYRKIVNRHFTPKAVTHLEHSIRTTVKDVLDKAPASEVIDAVDTLAAPSADRRDRRAFWRR